MHHYARHHGVTITLHWATALAILLAVAAVLLREVIEDDDMRNVLLNLHRSLGVLILLLAGVRLVARLVINASHVHLSLPKAIRLASTVGHLALFALPVTGWLLSNAEGKTVSPFGLFNLPMLVTKNRDLGDPLGDVHEPLPGCSSPSSRCMRVPHSGTTSGAKTKCCAPCFPLGDEATPYTTNRDSLMKN